MSLALSIARRRAALRHPPDDAPDPEAMFAALEPGRASAPPPGGLLRRYRLHRYVVAGRPVLRLEPRTAQAGWAARPVGRRGTPQRPELVYLHGGGYVFPMSQRQWATLTFLAEATGAALTVPMYGLAPEHTVADALPMLDEVMAGVRAAGGRAGPGRSSGQPGERVVVVGNSAGGGLALAHAIRCRDAGLPTPDALVLLSPWVEATLTNPAAKALEPRDVTLRCGPLAAAARRWAGDRDVEDPMVSPLSAELGGLPPLVIFHGDHDILLPDVRRFAAKARAAGTAVALTVVPGAHHGYVGSPWLPESRRTLAQAAAAIRSDWP